MMKKQFAMTLAAVLLAASLAGCGDKPATGTSSTLTSSEWAVSSQVTADVSSTKSETSSSKQAQSSSKKPVSSAKPSSSKVEKPVSSKPKTPSAASSSQPKLSETQRLGLGTKQTKYVSLNRNYEWYIDQKETGIHGGTNCAPSCCVMAAKWANKRADGSPEEVARAREKRYSRDIGWYFVDMTDYLDETKTPYQVVPDLSVEKVLAEMDKGNIWIFNLDTFDLTIGFDPETHVGRFYTTDCKHVVLAKGYRIVDGVTYLEMYDPLSMGAKYKDGQYKGKDRYYKAEEVVESVKNYYDYSIVVSPK